MLIVFSIQINLVDKRNSEWMANILGLNAGDGLEQMNKIKDNFLRATFISDIEKIEAYHNVFDDLLRSHSTVSGLSLFHLTNVPRSTSK